MSTLHVELLTKAREIIEAGQNRYLCPSLIKIATTEREIAARDELIEHIQELLGRWSTLGGWLHREQGIDVDQFSAEGSTKLRATRLAWIDWLIEEWRDAP